MRKREIIPKLQHTDMVVPRQGDPRALPEDSIHELRDDVIALPNQSFTITNLESLAALEQAEEAYYMSNPLTDLLTDEDGTPFGLVSSTR